MSETIRKTVVNANKKVLEFLNSLRSRFRNNVELVNLIKSMKMPENYELTRQSIDSIKFMQFIKILISNVKTLEDNIIIEYDSFNKYTKFDKLLSKAVPKDQKKVKMHENIRVLQKLPSGVSTQITLIPFVSTLTLVDVLPLFDSIKTLYAYGKVYLKLLNDMFKEQVPKTSPEMHDKIFSEVKSHVKQFNSNGLNIALDEVFSALSTNTDCTLDDVVVDGMNSVTSTKVMDMAKKVADKLTNKIESGEVEVEELVDSSKSFINNIINSDMFKNQPGNEQVKDMFGSLMDTVTELSEAYKENKDGEVIDEILEKYD